MTTWRIAVRRLAAGIVLILACTACAGERAPQSADPSSPAPPVAGTPVPVTSATPVPATASPVADVRWERVTEVDAPDAAGDWRILGSFDGGYVALQRTPPAAVFSPDGVTWTRTALDAPEGFATQAWSIASDGATVLIGGAYTPCPKRRYSNDPFRACRPRPVSWTSSDGLAWQSSGPWDGPIGEEGKAGSYFATAWSMPTGGWDAGQLFNPSDESNDFSPTGLAMWHSADGIDWAPLGEHTEAGAFRIDESFKATADAPGRRVAVSSSYGGGAPVFTSADGAVYAPVDSFPGAEPDTYMTALLPPVEAWPWRLFGGSDGGDVAQAMAWSSPDLRAWSTVVLDGAASASTVVLDAIHEPGRDVAVGRVGRDGATWISDQPGTWGRAASADATIETLAHGPAGTLGLAGTWTEDGDEVTGFEVWKLVQAP